jgi:hypothetical protein
MRTTWAPPSRITVWSIFDQPSLAPSGFSAGPHESQGMKITSGSRPFAPAGREV